MTVLVTGHTDKVGNAKNNETLSAALAKAVMAQLVTLGVAADRSVTMAEGLSQPIASHDSAQSHTANRRVEVLLNMG